MPDDPSPPTPVPPPPPDRLPFSTAAMVAVRAALSAVLAVVCCWALGVAQPVWAAVSAVVVSQASLHPSVRDSINRVLANLIGAGVGAIVSAFGGHSLWALALGIVLTGLACHLARLDAALRPAYAAVVIVIFTSTGEAWHESLNRVIAVSLGCASTLVIGLAHFKLARRPAPIRAPGPPNANE